MFAVLLVPCLRDSVESSLMYKECVALASPLCTIESCYGCEDMLYFKIKSKKDHHLENNAWIPAESFVFMFGAGLFCQTA